MYRDGCTLSHELPEHMKNKINPTPFVDGSGGECNSDVRSEFREMGRQALTGPSYDRALYPVSGSPVGCLGSLVGEGVEQRSTTEPHSSCLSEPPPTWTGPTSPAGCALRTLEARKNFLKRYRDCWLQPGP